MTTHEDLTVGSFEIDTVMWNAEIEHAVKDITNKIKLYRVITKSCEASVREFVSPVLSLAALIAEDIMMQAEKKCVWFTRKRSY